MNTQIIKKPSNTKTSTRSTLLFYYDSKKANPNGDPNTNEPRMMGSVNFVTDMRLKRTIRDYLQTELSTPIFYEPEWKKDGTQKSPEELSAPYLKKVPVKGKKKKAKEKTGWSVDREKFLDTFIDLRLFGFMLVIPNLDRPFKIIGPVQFEIGTSLNKVEAEIIPLTRKTTVSEDKRGGAMGIGHTILKYSFLEFLGTVNPAAISKENNLSDDDIQKMLTALWNGTDQLRTTSKNQTSRLLLKINVKDDVLLTDLTGVNTLENTEGLLNISDVVLNLTKSLEQFEVYKTSIESIEYKAHPLLVCKYDDDDPDSFDKIIEEWSKDMPFTVKPLDI